MGSYPVRNMNAPGTPVSNILLVAECCPADTEARYAASHEEAQPAISKVKHSPKLI